MADTDLKKICELKGHDENILVLHHLDAIYFVSQWNYEGQLEAAGLLDCQDKDLLFPEEWLLVLPKKELIKCLKKLSPPRKKSPNKALIKAAKSYKKQFK